MELTKEQLDNLKKLSDDLSNLMKDPHPKHNGWKIKVRITIKSISHFITE